jgi:rod shape determining protein RodA
MRIGSKLHEKIDLAILLPSILLMIFGLLAIYSSTVNHPTASGNFNKQFFWFFLSLAAAIIAYLLPHRTYRLLAVPSYIISIAMLALVLIMGKTVYGSKSWLGIGSLGMQPSEFAKIGLILFLAYWISRKQTDINSVKDLAIILAAGLAPIFLILLQPDMGTAIVFGLITLFMIFWGGISLFGLFVVLSPGFVTFASLFGTIPLIFTLVVVLALLIYFKKDLFISATVLVINIAAGFFFDYLYRILQPHQQKRIETFLDPNSDPLGAGYNALQAKVAIGSGGLVGKGFMEGNQTQLRFIPEQWTDFIYCVVGEEFGFIGSIIVIALFLVIFLRLVKLTSLARDKFSSLVVVGILVFLFIHFGINIGMNVGITPVIGLPLPFLSYGGSSLIVNMTLIGIALNIYKNRIQYE